MVAIIGRALISCQCAINQNQGKQAIFCVLSHGSMLRNSSQNNFFFIYKQIKTSKEVNKMYIKNENENDIFVTKRTNPFYFPCFLPKQFLVSPLLLYYTQVCRDTKADDLLPKSISSLNAKRVAEKRIFFFPPSIAILPTCQWKASLITKFIEITQIMQIMQPRRRHKSLTAASH